MGLSEEVTITELSPLQTIWPATGPASVEVSLSWDVREQDLLDNQGNPAPLILASSLSPAAHAFNGAEWYLNESWDPPHREWSHHSGVAGRIGGDHLVLRLLRPQPPTRSAKRESPSA